MMRIKHTGHSIETKAIELIDIHPEPQVAQQESQHLMAPIVKQTAIPLLMPTFRSLVEILMVRPIKMIQPIKDVLGGMAMDDIQQDCDAHAMRCVYELFEIIRETVATRRGKEAIDLVSEASVVCMFHDCHQLDDIVSQ